MPDFEDLKKELLGSPEKLMQKKPFYRGVKEPRDMSFLGLDLLINQTVQAEPTTLKVVPVSQDQFLKELDPASHDVLFDENVPSITMKTKDGGWVDIKFSRVAVPFQKIIVRKHVLHLTGNKIQHSLISENPDEKTSNNFMRIKQMWNKRNIDGGIRNMIKTQKSVGDAGLLFYFDRYGKIKCRVISYKDGYVLCPHNDPNGDRLLETIVYDVEGTRYIDTYDDKYRYRWTNSNVSGTSGDGTEVGWKWHKPVEHGFDEIPLITKRGDVAWNEIQSEVETYEVIYNVFLAIEKRHGWGVLYIKGNYDDRGKKLAGNIILNDTSIDGNGDAKYLTPPSPEHIIQTLDKIEDNIQKGSSATFILPKDIRLSGDISGVAIELTQSLDIENGMDGAKEWQNVIDKAMRLFKYGLAKEMVATGENPMAVTEYELTEIESEIRVWRPRNDNEYNQMITALTGAEVLSKETGAEVNTLSRPDEKARLAKQRQKELENEARLEEDKSQKVEDFQPKNQNE